MSIINATFVTKSMLFEKTKNEGNILGKQGIKGP